MNLGLPKSYIDSLLNPLILINISNEYLFRDIKTPNHESCFSRIFLSSSSWKKKIIGPNLKKKPVLYLLKVYFLFQMINLSWIHRKNWEKQDSWFDVTNKHVAATHNVFVYFCFVKTAFSFRKSHDMTKLSNNHNSKGNPV